MNGVVPLDRVAVLIATRGRPAILASLLRALAAQTRAPDRIVVVGAEPRDFAGVLSADPRLMLAVGPPGLPAQRNEAVRLAGPGFGTLVFFDDDFLPSRFWLERAAALFAARPGLVSLTGAVLADGNRSAGIPWADAEAIVTARDATPDLPAPFVPGVNPYGCNMAFRAAAMAGLSFDERLPLYAWLEDSDFGAQVARRGAVGRAETLWGVHLGHKTGKVAGVKLGYSQMINPVYLARKGTLTAAFSAKLMTKNVLANAVRSLSPEPSVDRPGRLRGNLIGLADLIRGRVTPERAASL